MISKLRMPIMALCMGLTSLLVAPQHAESSAGGCRGGSCVYVHGRGEYVEYVKGRFSVPNGGSVRGHIEIWGDGFHENSRDRTYRARFNSNGYPTYFTAIRINLRRNLRDRSRVCARFWVKTRTGYHGRPIACVEIRR